MITNQKREINVIRLMKLKKVFGWSQAQLAKEWNVSAGTIGLWESQHRTIPGPVLKLIEIYEQSHKLGIRR